MITALLLVLAQTATATSAPTKTPPPNPFDPATAVGTTPRALGSTTRRPDNIGSLGARVKVNRTKAETLFRQDTVPGPGPAPVSTPPAKPGKDAFAAMMAESESAERSWRDRETDRRLRLADARENQRDVCARYHAAAGAAIDRNGRTSTAAAALLGALAADCGTATRKADQVAAEAEQLAGECRQTSGCQPGWLR